MKENEIVDLIKSIKQKELEYQELAKTCSHYYVKIKDSNNAACPKCRQRIILLDFLQ